METLGLYKVKLSVSSGILHFKSIDELKSLIQRLQSLDIDQIIDWEKSIKFKSYFHCFQEIVESEWKQEEPGHSNRYKEGLSNQLIREVDNSFELNLFNPAYAYVLNEHGMIKIGRDLYQMTGDTVKLWYGGDAKDAEVLNSTTTNTGFIKLFPVSYQSNEIKEEHSYWSKICTQSGGQSRFKMEGRYFPNQTHPALKELLFINYLIIATTEIREDQNWKLDPWAFVQIRGYSLYKKCISDKPDKWRISYGSYEVSAEGGYRVIIPLEESSEKLNIGQEQEAYSTTLEEAVWRASAKSLSDEWMSCSISTRQTG